jgi:hypothetical protein
MKVHGMGLGGDRVVVYATNHFAACTLETQGQSTASAE